MKRFVCLCVALTALSVHEPAAAQILPPVVDPPTTIAQPSVGYPPTTAPTAIGPYFATPSWDQTLAPNLRFVILTNFSSDAVLDRETGLVWARRLVADSVPAGVNWFTADSACSGLIVGNRGGWRLPSDAELRTLIDFSNPVTEAPRLPTGHPFALVATSDFGDVVAWSDRAVVGNIVIEEAGGIPQTDGVIRRKVVGLRSGTATTLSIIEPESLAGALCVRGRQ
jgi:hypothetical protein